MSNLIRPFVKDRPICSTIRVDRDTIRSPEPESRIFSRVVRNSAGDLWTLRYMLGLPVNVTLHDSRRRLFLVFHPGESEPVVTPDHADPATRPGTFPQDAPDEVPALLAGIPCFYRKWISETTTTEAWYSYEYAADVRTVLKREGYGTTIWYLNEVKLEEPPADIFGESSILASEREHERNLWKVAPEVFRKMSADASSR